MLQVRKPTLASRISDEPLRVFLAFLAVHALVWTALPTLLYPNLPLDLIEALTYGREWQLGYDKLPPLPWWLVEITYRTIGHDVGYYLLAQIAVTVAFAFVFATARPIVGTLGALIGVLILDGFHYVNFTAAKFNHDVIQLPFWAMAGFAYHRALRGGAIKHWALLGLGLGCALWAKYFVVVLAAPLALFMLVDRNARRHFATPGPYVAAAVALLIAAPHVVWLVQTDFLPFAYVEARAAPSHGAILYLWHPIQFAIGQLFFGFPALLIAAPLFLPRRQTDATPAADAFDRRIVTVLAFGPAVAVLALTLVTGRGTIAMWGYPLWLFFGVFLVMIARMIDEARLLRIVVSWALVFCVLALAFIGSYAIMPYYDHRYRAVFFPGDRFAHELAQRYRAATGQPLTYVISSMWEGGNVAHYASEHPRVLIDGKPERTPWISLADLKAKGALVVWTDGDLRTVPPQYQAIAKDAQVQEPFLLPFRRAGGTLNVGWAILPAKP
ncbi:MAG TPA: glycosyltransferase family 39 protein [Pseudolabrys sp.]|nr:glycosyltransferase family 39 protein [Pseudolabrys sp.]